MNTKDILEIMEKLFSGFLFHPKFIGEMHSLLKKELSGKEGQFFKMLGTQLSNIRNFGPMIHTIDNNEKLKGLTRTYYSIHLQNNQFNVRLIIYFHNNNPLFLCAFYERKGKRYTDYSNYKKNLDLRLNQMLGDEKNE